MLTESELCEIITNSINEVLPEWTSRRRCFGGNSGYVGYSKSVRAVEAERRGLRNKSQMGIEFRDAVLDDIEQETGLRPKISLAAIKNNLFRIRTDEWHHTSKYGNQTNYYSAETIGDYFINALNLNYKED